MGIFLRPELKIMKALPSVNKFGLIHRTEISVTTSLLGWVGETALNLWRSLTAVAVYALRYQSIRHRLDVMQQQVHVVRQCCRRHTRSRPYTTDDCFIIYVMQILRNT